MSVVGQLAELIVTRKKTRIAIDGPDTAGKSTLAAALVRRIPGAVQATVDDFLNPGEVRYRQGSLSPKGYYEDSFDYDAVRERIARTDGVLLFDGVFLLRPELRGYWDLSIFLQVSPDEALRRALRRDAGVLGGEEAVRERYRKRYLPGQDLYRSTAAPTAVADVVIDNDDPARPRILVWPR
jgi:uridine kinase